MANLYYLVWNTFTIRKSIYPKFLLNSFYTGKVISSKSNIIKIMSYVVKSSLCSKSKKYLYFNVYIKKKCIKNKWKTR